MAAGRPLAALILAAGRGTRMKSQRPKVLHELGGRPMLAYSLEAAGSLGAARRLVVTGFGGDAVRERFAGTAEFVDQAEQRGTGHAVSLCREPLGAFDGDVLVLYGDTPLLRGETLERMAEHKAATGANAAATLVVAGVAKDLKDGAEQARNALSSGAARARLERLIAVSNA
jgi:bifunctional UDP-N-acetylglucosamine pyrophosphorylase/glucosamine-1-phosphate N-acetyltransferase